MHPKKIVCEVVSSKQITVISKEPVWVSPKPPDYIVTLFYKMEMKRAEVPSHSEQACHLSLSYLQILEGLVALWPPAPISCCHQILCLRVASCLWPAVLFSHQAFGVSPRQVTELNTGCPSSGQEPCLIPGTRPQAGGCSAKSIKVWPDRGGCDSRLALTYILTWDPDSHCNHAKSWIKGTPQARAVPRHHHISSWRSSQEESKKRLV